MLQVASKLDPADKEKITKEVEETISWLDSNQLAEVDELEHKLKELEGTCSPIISKMYQQVSDRFFFVFCFCFFSRHTRGAARDAVH